jgi:hypothetical protein
MTWTAAVRWYCLAVLLFLGIRAVSTLVAGASFEVPGTGWRAVWQLLLCAAAAVGLVRPSAARIAVAIVGAVYLLATVFELFHGTELLGLVPVDMRDRVVHPFLAVAAVGCVVADAVRGVGVGALHD